MESEDEWKLDNLMDSAFKTFGNQEIIQRDRIILKNLPSDLTQQGLRNMFGDCGTITDVTWPIGQSYAFIKFKSAAEAANLLRCKNDIIGSLKIIAEYARNRPIIPRLSPDLDFLNDQPATDDSKEPIRNVLELNKRRIQGPFGDPTEVHNGESLISPKDYSARNLLLKCTDPTKEYLWNSNDEVSLDCEFKEFRKKIVHGRAILLNAKVNDTTTIESNKKSFSFNSHLIPNIKYCANCSQPADKNCKNCEKTHCSLECHANACKIDDDVKVEQIERSKLPSRIEAQAITNAVKITAVLNHRLVFLRPATTADDIAFARLNCDTVRSAKDADSLTFLPQVGSLVLAKFDFYQRALVLKHVSKTAVAVVFIDYGNIEIREFHELKTMPDKLKTIKRFASKFELNNIENDIINFAAIKVLYRYMANETELRFELNANNHCVNLKTSDKWVNEMVNKMNVQNVKCQDRSNADRIFFDDIPIKQIDSDMMRGKEVIILDNSQIGMRDLAFIDAEDFNVLRENDRRIQNVCNYLFSKDELYTPWDNECCVIKYKNGRWYRTYCVEVLFDGFATMHFIDFGNMRPIEISDIRPIPEALLFESVTITADCFSDCKSIINVLVCSDVLDTEKSEELKDLYPIQSRYKIERMEVKVSSDEVDQQQLSISAWLQKI